MQFTSVHVQGYRCFEDFTIDGLGRINLLVGLNNSGKTSVLEAIYLLAAQGDPLALWQILTRRGERSVAVARFGDSTRVRARLIEVGHLFRGHDIFRATPIRVNGITATGARELAIEVVEASRQQSLGLEGDDEPPASFPRLALRTTVGGRSQTAPLSRVGGLDVELVQRGDWRLNEDGVPVKFVSVDSTSSDELIQSWNRIVLSPEETLVLEALRSLDPEVERLAHITSPGAIAGGRTGFLVKMKGSDTPVPIGSLGDGMWRMMALATAVTQCKGGLLLVDEIDTGFHWTVMPRMWTMLFQAAREFDVQIFATTHSYDCVRSLAQVCSSDSTEPFVTVHRIERGKRRSVPYDEGEIAVAATHDIEVR